MNRPWNAGAAGGEAFKILVIKPSSLGDVVHTLPAVALLKKHWPEAHLRWLVNPEWAPLLAGNPHVDEVVLFPRGEFRGVRGLGKIPRWAKEIAARKADLVLDFQGLLRSALIARLCRGGEVVGLSDAREGARFLYDRVVDVAGHRHAVDRYLALVAALGVEIVRPLEWPLPAGEAVAAAGEPGFVLLHPFARGAGKSLGAADVADFCRALAPRRVVIAGRAEAPLPAIANGLDLLNGTTLAELVWLIRHAAFVVSVDSGPLHIAAALTPQLVAIHTWSDPRKVGPYRDEAWILQNGALCQRSQLDAAAPHERIADAAALGGWLRGRLG